MLGGGLAHDMVIGRRPGRAALNLMGSGILLMSAAWGLSCLSTVYDISPDAPPVPRDIAENPVFPSREQLQAPGIKMAELPFMPPPPKNTGELQRHESLGQVPVPPRLRRYNYWMMSKRLVSIPFAFFATGFSMAVLAGFVVLTDMGGVTVGLFRTFGTNALAAYFLHHSLESAVLQIVPKDSPLWWCLVGLAIFYLTTYLFIRFLEKQRVFIRL